MGLNKKRKEGILTALTTVFKKDPTTLIRKHTNWKSTRKLWGQQLNKIQTQTYNPLITLCEVF